MHPAIAIAIPASVGCAGALLVARGLIGRRVATEPRCRRCDYELTDLLTHRCPECGTVIYPERIRTSRRIRFPKYVAWGMFLVVLGGSTDWFRVPQRIERFVVREEWYEYAPTAYVMRRVEQGDARWRKELFRRVLTESVRPTELRDTVALALARQKSPERYSDASEWIDLLELLSVRKRLSAAELRAFYLEIADPYLQVRPRVRVGELLPFRISVWCAAPATHIYEWTLTSVRVLVDAGELSGGLFSEQRGTANVLAATPTRGGTLDSAALAVGRHRMEVHATFELYDAPFMGYGKTEPPLIRRELRLSATFEILPANVPDTVTTLRRLEAYRDLCTSFSASVKKLRTSTDRSDVICIPTIRLLKQLPCDVAFEVEMRSTGQTWPVGKLAIGRAERWPAVFTLDTVELASPEADCFMSLRLTSSADVARESVDAFSIWDGTIEFRGDGIPKCGH